MKTCLTVTFLLAVLFACLPATSCNAAEVVIVADSRLKPAVEIISGIRKTLSASTKTYSPSDVQGRLGGIVEKEKARAVIALGREALNEALRLPTSIPVIYGMMVTPPRVCRANTAGFYMAIPTRQYLDLINNHLRSIKRIAVVGNRDQVDVLAGDTNQQVTPYSVRNCYELVTALRQLNGADAVLLLPDSSLLTATAMEEAFLLSFRKKTPLLGIAEWQVRDGALLALVVDTVHQGRLIGESASKALKGIQIGQLSATPPRQFELFLNLETARKMGIKIPDELLRMSRRIYP